MNIILFDNPQDRIGLKPFSDTRPLAHIRLGITTIEQKWRYHLPGTYSFLTATYLRKKFPSIEAPINWCINSIIFPNTALVKAIKQLQLHEQLVQNNTLLAFVAEPKVLQHYYHNGFKNLDAKQIIFQEPITQINNKCDIFLLNETMLKQDFQEMRARITSSPIQDPYTKVYNTANILIEAGVIMKAAILNAELGPIYIGKNAIIHEGAMIRGPVSIGQGAQVMMGAKIYNATTIGPYVKVGGEVSNTVIFGYSNKAHEGFAGSSVIGEWCNLGGGTMTSNIKNDYSLLKVWDYQQKNFVSTQLQFCGSLMGDYSKCGTSTMFNPGTVIGVSANLFGTCFHNKFIPSFAYGGSSGHIVTYKLDKALASAAQTMKRRGKQLTPAEQQILIYLFEESLKD